MIVNLIFQLVRIKILKCRNLMGFFLIKCIFSKKILNYFFFLQSAFSKPQRFFIAPLTKYVFNYVSRVLIPIRKNLRQIFIKINNTRPLEISRKSKKIKITINDH